MPRFIAVLVARPGRPATIVAVPVGSTPVWSPLAEKAAHAARRAWSRLVGTG
jgi:hypothetical protein